MLQSPNSETPLLSSSIPMEMQPSTNILDVMCLGGPRGGGGRSPEAGANNQARHAYNNVEQHRDLMGELKM